MGRGASVIQLLSNFRVNNLLDIPGQTEIGSMSAIEMLRPTTSYLTEEYALFSCGE
jgi:hypothetical protein